ncbi:P pilus assembly protein, pilin FimA [Escherichia coli]|uniref:P pilus assembly protein, pilin FimA n=1 Tax=Escherichia coli TaxID=562 RepID=A0A376NZV2_ECOLX|nr:P pilus assembly protein, pilin FimA [Escherichia coli]
MKWRKRGYLLAAILALASATIQAADVTITVNGKVVAKPCTVSTTNATVDLRRSLFFQSDVCRGGIGLA